ncbi:hypothetical protein AB0C52_16955 [Streptomyces sp. NPDC048717]|uniref:hypothetical protein n=1 Tax=Streptomyces sp. NPDC048717 TaxID=3154928 RepID=UPI0034344715
MTEPVTHAVPALLAAASEQGPGNTLRILLLASMIGGALLAWFLLRGYRQTGTDADADTGADTAADAAGDPAAPASPESPSAASATSSATPAARTGNGSTDAHA